MWVLLLLCSWGLTFIIRPGSDHCLALSVSSWMTDFIETWIIRLYQLLVYFDADVDLGAADSLFRSIQLTLLWQLLEGLLANKRPPTLKLILVFIQKFIKKNHPTLGPVVPLDKGLYHMANLPQKTSDNPLPAKIHTNQIQLCCCCWMPTISILLG